jgi:hypothetical protein
MHKSLIYIFLLFIGFLSLSSCQEEIEEINEPPAEQAFTAKSPVASLVQRIALKDGSEDNIISGASCISFALPITVIVNGQELLISTEEDYNKVERILDQYEDDEDSVQKVFPVTVILADYTEVTINNEDELEDYMEECMEGGDDEDIECVDFQYPLEFSLYDAQNQVTDNATINNDQELFKFLDGLEDNVYVSLDFPVTLILSDGSKIIASNNKELEDIIDNAKEECDEDDDNDFDDDDIDDTEFKAFITSGKWKVTSYVDGNTNSDAFDGIEFSFNEDGYILASDGIETAEGEWESYGDSGVLEIDLDFDSIEPYKDLNEEWQVISYTNSRINLEDTSGGADFTVVFEKI